MTAHDPATVRPLRADARRNRARVLAAAADAFAEEGSGATLDGIAARAGVGPGTVYRHFATKEALFGAVVVDRIGVLADEGRAALGADDPGVAFTAFCDTLVVEGARKLHLIEAFAAAGARPQLELGDALAALTDTLGLLLGRAQAAGVVRADVDADDVLALLAGASVTVGGVGTDRARAARLLAVVHDGLRAGGGVAAPAG